MNLKFITIVRGSNFRAKLFLVFGLSLLTSHCSLLTLFAAEGSAAPSETDLLEKQRTLEKDLEQRVQSILEKILGPNQSEVKATVNLSISKQVQKKTGAGQRTKHKENEDPLGGTRFILPGVPAPKNVGKEKEPESIEKQQAEQEREQTQVSFKINVSNRQVIAFYNEKLKKKEAEAKKAVMAMTDLNDNELKFIPGKFFSSFSNFWPDFVRDPKNLLLVVLLFLLSLLLIWLFVPLSNFFSNYVRAIKEKAGIEVKMETSEEGMDKSSMSPEEAAKQELGENPENKEGDDDMNKKYAPFEYINEENMKRLLGVFRKEQAQVIALVLSYLKPELVKKIYSELPIDLQTKVATESAAVRQTSEEQVRVIDADIKAKIDFLVGGVDNLITLLEEVDYKIRDNILEYLKDHKPQVYEKVRSSLLLFDDIYAFPDLAMQTIIRELKTDQLARALKNASPEILNKFLSNMSQGGAALLKEEMEFGRPVTAEQIDMERQNIMDLIKKLELEGKIQVREKKKISIFESEDALSPLMPSLPNEERLAGRPAFGTAETAPPNDQLPAANLQGQEAGGPPSVSAEELASYLSYGEQLYSEGKYEEALPYLQYVVEADPNHAEAYKGLGHCYYGLGMTEQALQFYEYALSLSPTDEQLRQWIEQFKQSVGA